MRQAYENRARAFVSKGDYTRAVADVTKAGELTPKMAVQTRRCSVSDRTQPQKVVAKPVVPEKPAQPRPRP